MLDKMRRATLPAAIVRRLPGAGLFGTGALIGFIRLGGIGMTFALQAWLARSCGPYEYGIYATYWSILLAGSIAGNLGLSQGSMRFIPGYLAFRDYGRIKGYLIFNYAVAAAVAGLAATLVVLGGRWLMPGPADVAARTFAYMVALVPLTLVVTYMNVGLALHHPMRAFATYSFGLPTLFLGGFGLAQLFGAPSTALTIGIVLASAMTGLFLLSLVGLVEALHRKGVTRAASRFEIRGWIGTATPLFFSSVLEVCQIHAGTWLTGLLLSADAVGLYFVANRICGLFDILLLGYGASAVSLLGQHFASGEIDKMRAVFRRTALASMGLSMVLFAVIFLFADQLLVLFGPQFSASREPLIILCAAAWVKFSLGPCNYLLIAVGDQRVVLRATIVTLLTTVVSVCILALQFGLIGVAMGSALGSVVGTTILATRVAQRFALLSAFPVWWRVPGHA